MYDLIYLDNTEQKLEVTAIAEKAGYNVEEASDFIHRARIAITKEQSDEEHLVFLLDNGLWFASMTGQLFSMEKPKEALAFVKDWKDNQE